jgi:hypothetical protein
MYCNSKTMGPLPATGVSAACNTAQDLPISGGCSSGGSGPDIALNVDEPFGWNGSSGLTAEWHCGWTSGSSGAVNVSDGLATICCVKHP